MTATLPLAGRSIVPFGRGAVGFDADAIEIFRVKIHGSIMVGPGSADKARDD
jgi:hypothetical protein